MYGYIYLTVDLLKGRVYVGQHKSKEYDKNYLGSGKIIKNIIKSRKDTLKNYVIEWCNTAEELDDAEIKWISCFREECVCMNVADGGSSSPMMGKHLSNETKQKISLKKKGCISPMKGRHLSEEAKQILSQKMTGRYIGRQMSEQQKHKISEKLLGHAVSNDARKKMREAKLGKTGPWLGEHRDNKTREKISLKLKNSKWMTNGEMVKYVSPEETKIYLEMGWVFGRKIK